jgi:predicted O-methyltransferase YrrM
MIESPLQAYAEAHTTPEIPILARLNRETNLTQIHPQMLSGHLQGTLLRMFCQMIRPERILEIGAFTGYSAISLALGLGHAPSGIVHTIEINPEQEQGIRQFIREAGLEEQVILHIGKAIEIIPALTESWDLVFIDADKPNYLNYYKMVLPHVRQGGFIMADNVLWDGKVIGDPAKMDKDTLGIIEFNDFVHQDDHVENAVLPFRDGLMIIRKK